MMGTEGRDAHRTARSGAGLALMLASALLAACAVGPDYRPPTVGTTPVFKELGNWQPSEPLDALQRGPWWQIFKDPVLDQLEQQVVVSNQTVKAAAAAYEQALALVAQSRAGYWPSEAVTAGKERGQTGAAPIHSSDLAGATASWEMDIWGQIRRGAEGSSANARASAAALGAAQLSSQAALATAYFQLRAQDALRRLLDDTVAGEEQSLKIAQNRYAAGVAAKADVVTAQTQLLGSQAQQLNSGIQRAQLEHAIAVLTGQVPAAFALVLAPMPAAVPTVSAGIPATLLERRPDVAEAERKVAAANAQIGVARAAYFPSLTLSGSDNYSGGPLSRLINVPNRVWSFGPALAASLFDGGLRRAQSRQAWAGYNASVANYRQSVLSAFQQVEDNLVAMRILEQQAVVEEQAVKAAHEAEALILNQYKAGTVPYSSVIAAQTTTFASEQAALSVLQERLSTSIAMIVAVGGGWKMP